MNNNNNNNTNISIKDDFFDLLEILDYPLRDIFDINSTQHYYNLILFLENKVIRYYKISQRDELINNLSIYLKELKYPFDNINDHKKVIEWLLIYATNCLYSDNAGNYNKIANNNSSIIHDNKKNDINSKKDDKMNIEEDDDDNNDLVLLDDSKNTDNDNVKDEYNSILKKWNLSPYVLEPNSKESIEFKEKLYHIIKLLNIDDQIDINDIDILTLLRLIYYILKIQNIMEPEPSNNNNNNTSKINNMDVSKYINDILDKNNIQLGFTTGDNEIDNAAKCLRLLYISDIKELQMSINTIIEYIQEYTANPRINSKLGKVGR